MFDGQELSEIEEQIERVQEVGWTTEKLLLHIIRTQDNRWERYMADVQTVLDAITAFGTDLGTKLTDLKTAVDALVAAGSVPPADLQPVVDALAALQASTDSGVQAVTDEATAAVTPPAPMGGM